MTEETLRARLRDKLTPEYLRDTLDAQTTTDEHGLFPITNFTIVAAMLADWLAQECCDEADVAVPQADGAHK